ncbi:LysR substrate-binding domain-containing protein [Azorhizophilus paspali]|uniref:LysR substrate-binding domain-containing protein n=1 Tax=Azorhizophilus paspali TaxID=69963 RepID=A0ABV6SJN7_AZOPA
MTVVLLPARALLPMGVCTAGAAAARAEELKPCVSALLDEIARTFAPLDAFKLATSTGHFRILANDYATLAMLTPLAACLRQRAPGIVLGILFFDRRFEERFAAREADLVMGGRQPARLPLCAGVVHRTLPVAAARRPSAPGGDATIALDAFLAKDHVLVSSRGRVVDKPLAALGHSRRVVLTFPHFLVAPAVVARTDLVMTVPACIAHGYAKGHALRLFEPPLDVAPFDVAFAWPARSVADPAMQWMRQQFEDAAQVLRQHCPDKR